MFPRALALALLWAACCSAVWVPVKFIVAGSRWPAAIVGRRWQAPGGPWIASTVWRAPDATKGPLLAPEPGVVDTAWLSFTEDKSMWRNGGCAVRLAALWAPGDTSRWSNLEIVATGCPRDTALFDAAGSSWAAGACQAWAQTAPNGLKPIIYQATWVRADGDTILKPLPGYAGLGARGPVIHYDDLLTALPAVIRPTYCGFCMKGSR